MAVAMIGITAWVCFYPITREAAMLYQHNIRGKLLQVSQVL